MSQDRRRRASDSSISEFERRVTARQDSIEDCLLVVCPAEGNRITSKWFVGKAPAESRMEEELDRDKKRLKVGRIGEYATKWAPAFAVMPSAARGGAGSAVWVIGEDKNLGKVANRWGIKMGKMKSKKGIWLLGQWIGAGLVDSEN